MNSSRKAFNIKANCFWQDSKLSKIRGLFIRESGYKLTYKQLNFIDNGLKKFKEQYLKDLTFYNTNYTTWNWAVNYASNWLFFNKLLKLFSQPQKEAAGAGAVLVAIDVHYKNVDKIKETEETRKRCVSIKPCVEFFGSIENAETLFTDFLIQMAVRFQHAIELLDNNSEGIKKFVHFIVERLIQEIFDSSHTFNSMSSSENKIKLLIETALEPKKSPDKEFNDKWKDLKLKTIDGMMEWSIDGLLYTSAIANEENLLIYNGDKANQWRCYPSQICTNIETRSSYNPIKY